MSARKLLSLGRAVVDGLFYGVAVIVLIETVHFSKDLSAELCNDAPFRYVETNPDVLSPDPNNTNPYVNRLFRPVNYDSNTGKDLVSKR